MLGFPVSTEFNKRIPKQKFYDKQRRGLLRKRLPMVSSSHRMKSMTFPAAVIHQL